MSELERLEAALDEAVESENYELAAEIRDKISKLRNRQ
jgi:protein-arginine kinase activator protein McsA